MYKTVNDYYDFHGQTKNDTTYGNLFVRKKNYLKWIKTITLWK